MTLERFVPQGDAANEERLVSSRRVALAYHFSRFITPPPPSLPPATCTLSFRLRQFRIQRGRAASIVHVYRYERAVQTIHMQIRDGL